MRPLYFLLYATVSKFTSAQRETLVHEIRDAVVKDFGNGRVLVEQRPYSTEGCHGIALEMRSQDSLTFDRICVSEQRAYILIATAYNEPAKDPHFADRFLNSFRIESPTATPRPSP